MPATENIPNDLAPAVSETPATNHELCPLSFAQERLWFLDQLHPGNPAYNIPQAWRLTGELNLSAFENALNEIVRRHESLRTTFTRVDGKPVEVISAFRPISVAVINFSDVANAPDEAHRRMDESARRPFDLTTGPLFRVELFRVSAGEHLALFNLHHIIADAWSFEILRTEMTAAYTAACAGRRIDLPEVPVQYLDYAQWQREQAADGTFSSDLQFWQQHLSGELPKLELPADAFPAEPGFSGNSEPISISSELTSKLRELARGEGTTLFSVLFAAFNAFLHRITGQTDLVVGTPVSGRSQSETAGLIGIFVNTLAVRTRLDGDPSFLELLAQVRDTVFSALAHQEIPFEAIVNALQPERAPGQNPLIQVVLALHGGYPAHWMLGDLRASILEIETHTAKFDWTLLLEETDCGMKGRLEYKTDLFEANTIKRFLQQFHIFLTEIAAHPQRRISGLPLLPSAARRQILVDWNQTATPYERDSAIHELFEAQAEVSPKAIALVAGATQLTYRELNHRANQLAWRLKRLGVTVETPVGVCLERSPEMIIALLAILKAGGAYVSLDRSYPRERIEFMIRDANLAVLITDSHGVDACDAIRGCQGTATQLLCLDHALQLDVEPIENLGLESNSEQLAYIMYTSGSTGAPKGTLIPHRGVVRLVRHSNYVSISPDDVFLQLAPISFDASTFEIWGSLLNGAKLVLFPAHTPSLEELGRTIEHHAITILWLTAGLFHQMADEQLARMKSLRQLLAGGDVLSVAHVLKTIRELPHCTLINGYGPTENTTFTCCYPVPAHWSGGRSVPIGKPINQTRIYILDSFGNPVPVGVSGELFVAGDGLARGYLNSPALTREKFVSAKIIAGLNELAPEEILYRTGDLARWLPDGNLEFLGRKDQQLKIRGHRVEPGEIEAVLHQHAAVREAAVVAQPATNGERQLVAYVTLTSKQALDESTLREFLNSKLPTYMIPSRIIELAALPRNGNGKIDRRALPASDASTTSDSAAAPPRNPTEAKLQQIWQEILGRNSFGVHDNFFHLGGHSLLATQVVSRIARHLLVELPVRAIFETPTISGLARQIEGAPTAPVTATIPSRRQQRAEARRLLSGINQLSDSEVDSLLSRPL